MLGQRPCFLQGLLPRLLLAYLLLFCAVSVKAAQALASSGNELSDLDLLEGVPPEGPRGAAKSDLRPSDVIHWQTDHAEAYGDGTVLVALRLETEQGFALYTDKVLFTSPSGYLLVNQRTPASEQLLDPVSGKSVQVYRSGEFFLLFSGLQPFQEQHFPLSIRYLSCTTSICLFPYTETLAVSTYPSHERSSPLFASASSELGAIQQHEAEKEPARKKIAARVADTPEQARGQQNPEAGQDLGLQDWQAQVAAQVRAGKLPLLWLLALLFVGGLLTNLTPCVYPMIPITIRILAGQARSPFSAAAAYASGIVASYTLLGLFAASTGSMFGSLMASPVVNSVLALVMAVLALSMLGFGNFTALQNLGQRVGSRKSGLKNAFLMGAGAGLVASPCTGPILAALLAYTASQKESTAASLLLFTYSLGFALPYLLLGSASARVAQLRVGVKVQVVVKLLFAAVLFALSFYYLRIPLYVVFKHFQSPHWAWWVSCSTGLGAAALLGLLRQQQWPHKKGLMLLPAVFTGAALFGLFTLSQQLASQRFAASSLAHAAWFEDEEAAWAEARKRRAPLLLDFWAEWCEACKKLDRSTFADPELQALLQTRGWVQLKLDLTEASEKNDMIQLKYGVKGLPTLILIPDPTQPEQRQSIEGYISAQALQQRLMQLPAAGG